MSGKKFSGSESTIFNRFFLEKRARPWSISGVCAKIIIIISMVFLLVQFSSVCV